MIRLAVLGSTSGTDLGYILEKIVAKELDAKVAVVISNKEQAFILERARNHNIEAVFINPKDKSKEEFDKKVMDILEEKNIELVLLIGFMRIIGNEFVKKWKNKIMNVHPSLLPKYAGMMGSEIHKKVIENKDEEAGMTIHFVDEGVDTGPIILQAKYTILPEDTEESLKRKIQIIEGEGYVRAIRFFAEGKIVVNDKKVIVND